MKRTTRFVPFRPVSYRMLPAVPSRAPARRGPMPETLTCFSRAPAPVLWSSGTQHTEGTVQYHTTRHYRTIGTVLHHISSDPDLALRQGPMSNSTSIPPPHARSRRHLDCYLHPPSAARPHALSTLSPKKRHALLHSRRIKKHNTPHDPTVTPKPQWQPRTSTSPPSPRLTCPFSSPLPPPSQTRHA